MEEFLIIFEGIFSPRLKKILDFNALKCTRMNEFQIIFMVEKYFLTPKWKEFIFVPLPPEVLEIFSNPPKISKNEPSKKNPVTPYLPLKMSIP